MPNIQLFPLIPKAAGILRDGSLYQGDYCTDGQWVRFYQGKPKKIGGMKAIERASDGKRYDPPQNCNHITSVWVGDNIIYLAISDKGIFSNIAKSEQPYIFQKDWKTEITFINQDKGMLWQSAVVISPNRNENGDVIGNAKSNILLFGCNNLQNINNTIQAIFYIVELENNHINAVTSFEINNNPNEDLLRQELQNLNGGIVFSNPFLFVYGTKGTVIWSRRENPFSFLINLNGIKGAAGRINISDDKVIYGSAVRGGNNPPTILFWTMNSVVRISNQSDMTGIGSTPEFQIDVISKETSILSSRSVVEYDGMFFWLGIDRMFLYNGVVREIVNNTNFNWFFENLDVLKRQLVFGIKNSEKGEIWWYFPRKDKPNEGCSHALIYNIRENIWYDTSISRDCGFFDGSSGKMITYGKNLVSVENERLSYVWVHEEGYKQISDMNNFTMIESSYTTPIISLTAFSPSGEGGGQNNEIWVDRIEPDFTLGTNAVMIMNINSKIYADQPLSVSAPYTINAGGGKVDVRFQGRNISFTFTTTYDFTHGYPLIGIKVGDARG